MGRINIHSLVCELDSEYFEQAKMLVRDVYLNQLMMANGEYSPARTMLRIVFNDIHSNKITNEELGDILKSSFIEATHDPKCIYQYMMNLRSLLADENDDVIHSEDVRTQKYISCLEERFYSIGTNETKLLINKSDEEVTEYLVDYLRIVLAMYGNKTTLVNSGKKVLGVQKMDFSYDVNRMYSLSKEVLSINRKDRKIKLPWDKQAKGNTILFASLYSWLLFLKMAQDEGVSISLDKINKQ